MLASLGKASDTSSLWDTGGAVGGAIAGAIWTTLIPIRLRHRLPATEYDRIPDILGSITVALSYEPGTPERIAINDAYIDVQRLLNFVALAILVPALISMAVMRDVRLELEDSHRPVVILGQANRGAGSRGRSCCHVLGLMSLTCPNQRLRFGLHAVSRFGTRNTHA